MDLKELRQSLDCLDDEFLKLFEKRMDVVQQIAEYKRNNDLPVFDPSRERQKLADISKKAKEEMRSYAHVLYSLLFELSRSYQGRLLHHSSELEEQITTAIDHTQKLFPQDAVVACQGVEGAYSQLACEKLFRIPNIMYFNSFDKVFSAIDSDLCRYGLLPLENSTAGSVNKVYDLMLKHNFSIVRSVRLKVDHNLLAKKGTNLSDIKEIVSHEQAIGQCADFLKTLGNVKLTPCENTAVAAEMVAASQRSDIAALSSRICEQLYSLNCIASSVQDKGNNYTRFICISKDLEIYPGADKTSVMMIVSHKPGSLYKVLSRLYALGINLIKLESRPLPDRDFEFMFYFDLETSIYSAEFVQMICELNSHCEEFRYLGSYSEIV